MLARAKTDLVNDTLENLSKEVKEELAAKVIYDDYNHFKGDVELKCALRADLVETNRQIGLKATYQELHHLELKEAEDRDKLQILEDGFTVLKAEYTEQAADITEKVGHITGVTVENKVNTAKTTADLHQRLGALEIGHAEKTTSNSMKFGSLTKDLAKCATRAEL